MERVEIAFSLPRWLVDPLKRSLRADRGQSLLGLVGDRDIEWSWVCSKMPAGPGKALDFGPGGSMLGLVAAQKGFDVLAVDLMAVEWPYRHPRLKFEQGDILGLSLEPESFDLIINCSSIEHVGLPGRYGVRLTSPDGDLRAMEALREALKQGGSMLLTIPIGLDSVFAPLHRVYGRERLPILLDGLEIESEVFWTKNSANQWEQVDREKALNAPPKVNYRYPGRSVYGLGCFVARKRK